MIRALLLVLESLGCGEPQVRHGPNQVHGRPKLAAKTGGPGLGDISMPPPRLPVCIMARHDCWGLSHQNPALRRCATDQEKGFNMRHWLFAAVLLFPMSGYACYSDAGEFGAAIPTDLVESNVIKSEINATSLRIQSANVTCSFKARESNLNPTSEFARITLFGSELKMLAEIKSVVEEKQYDWQFLGRYHTSSGLLFHAEVMSTEDQPDETDIKLFLAQDSVIYADCIGPAEDAIAIAKMITTEPTGEKCHE